MSYYPEEDAINQEFDNRKAKPFYIEEQGEVKKSFDFLITTPGMLRRGVARHGDALRGFVDYNLKLFRSEDRLWTLYLEWVDLKGDGHRVVLPHEVVQATLQRANSIIAQARKARAQHAADTRRRKQQLEKVEAKS